MLRAGIDVVAVPIKMSADGAVVTGDDIAIHPRRRELEEPVDRRQQAAHDLAADGVAHLRMQHAEIVAALEPVVDDGRGLAVFVEQKAGILAAELLVKLNEKIAELGKSSTRGTIRTGAVIGTPAESSTEGRLRHTVRIVLAWPSAKSHGMSAMARSIGSSTIVRGPSAAPKARLIAPS